MFTIQTIVLSIMSCYDELQGRDPDDSEDHNSL